MNKKVQTRRLNDAILKLQSAKSLIKTKRFIHAKQQIHEAVSSCGCIVKSKQKKMNKPSSSGGV
jgi:hypothetical protein